MRLDVERSDYMRTPGRAATLKIGPFWFMVDTSDSGNGGFAIIVNGWQIDWGWRGYGEGEAPE